MTSIVVTSHSQSTYQLMTASTSTHEGCVGKHEGLEPARIGSGIPTSMRTRGSGHRFPPVIGSAAMRTTDNALTARPRS